MTSATIHTVVPGKLEDLLVVYFYSAFIDVEGPPITLMSLIMIQTYIG